MIRLILKALRSPSDFRADPRGYALNQAGHMALGFGAALLLPWWAVLAAYLAWEGVQLARFGAAPHDAAEDTGFVVAGLAAASGQPLALAPAALMLAAGVLARRVSGTAG